MGDGLRTERSVTELSGSLPLTILDIANATPTPSPLTASTQNSRPKTHYRLP